MGRSGRNPTFLIVGAMKAGTTSLYEVLLRHPEVHLPGIKEPNTLRSLEVETPEGLAAYQQLFAGAGSATAVGEASTNYTKRHEWDGVAERARRILGPELSIVYVVRDPLQRLVSHVNHDRLAGRAQDPIGEITLESGPVQVSRYHHQIEPWLDAFGRDRVLVVDLAALQADPTASLRAVYDHIGVDPDLGPCELVHSHGSDGKRVEGRRLRRYVTGSDWYTRHLRGRLPAGIRRSLRSALVRPTGLRMLGLSDLELAPGVVDELNDQLGLLANATGVRLTRLSA